MQWLIIALVVILVIGPVMYLAPTAKDRRLTALRTQARQEGLSVNLSSVPKLDPTADERVSAAGAERDPRVMCAHYRLPLRSSLLPFAQGAISQIDLLISPAEPTRTLRTVTSVLVLDPTLDRTLQDTQLEFLTKLGAEGLYEHLEQLLSALPEDVLGVSLSNTASACFWRERGSKESGEVVRIKRALEEFNQHLTQLLPASPKSV